MFHVEDRFYEEKDEIDSLRQENTPGEYSKKEHTEVNFQEKKKGAIMISNAIEIKEEENIEIIVEDDQETENKKNKEDKMNIFKNTSRLRKPGQTPNRSKWSESLNWMTCVGRTISKKVAQTTPRYKRKRGTSWPKIKSGDLLIWKTDTVFLKNMFLF